MSFLQTFLELDRLNEWLDSNGQSVTLNSKSNVTQPPTVSPSVKTDNIVTIVYDVRAHKLRAVADDGVHGYANVAFPNNLRTHDGQQYKVDTLLWNGKNYRVSGSIIAI
jgi:hypothetical protein